MLTKARILFLVGMLCFVPFFFPTFQHDVIPNGTDDIITLGIPASPWFEHHSMETKVETEKRDEKTGAFLSHSYSWNANQHTSVNWLSWSWLFVIAGVTAFVVSGRMKVSATVKTPS
jgi:hypothetical protein